MTSLHTIGMHFANGSRPVEKPVIVGASCSSAALLSTARYDRFHAVTAIVYHPLLGYTRCSCAQIDERGMQMTIRLVGAGLYRTGTKSLKSALETLLGKPSYHMAEVFIHPEHIPVWHDAALGKLPDWPQFLKGYAATLDAPAAYFWPEISAAFPDALVLLSVRSEESWWQSASQTVMKTKGLVSPEWDAMNDAVRSARFSTIRQDKESMIRGFRDHNEKVRREVEVGRLLEWTIGDGWEPLCRALDLPVPVEPFPHTNTTEEWLEREALRNPGRS